MNAPAPPPAARWGALAWVLLPPLVVLLLRALLQSPVEDDWQPLREATQVTSPGQALWAATRPLAYTALALLALGLGVRQAARRWGWARLRPLLLALWLLLWAGVGAGSLAQHLNRSGRQALPETPARVLLAGDVAPSARGPGGAQVYLALLGQEDRPVYTLAPGLPARAFTGRHAQVRLQAGRWWGRWAQVRPEGGDNPEAAQP